MSDLDKPDLGAVLTHYGVTYRNGRNSQKILCPVQQETRESCSINLSEGWYNCHGCGSAGDTYTLIMEMEGIDFVTAVQFAESFTGVSSRHIRGANNPRTDGLLGHTRPERRDNHSGTPRPSLRALGGA